MRSSKHLAPFCLDRLLSLFCSQIVSLVVGKPVSSLALKHYLSRTKSIIYGTNMTIHQNIAVFVQQPSLAVFFPLEMFLLSFKVRPKLGLIRNPPNREKNFLIFFGQKNLRVVQVRASKYFFHWNCCCPKVTRPGFAQNHFKFKACWVFFWPAQVHKLSKREGLNFLLNPLKLYECFDALNCHHVRPQEGASRITFCSYLQTPDLVICHVRLHILTNHLMPERKLLWLNL